VIAQSRFCWCGQRHSSCKFPPCAVGEVQQPDGRDGRRLVIRHCATVLAEKGDETPGGADAVFGGFTDASQEEVRPALPDALVAHFKKPTVVVRPMPLEGKAQVQKP